MIDWAVTDKRPLTRLGDGATCRFLDKLTTIANHCYVVAVSIDGNEQIFHYTEAGTHYSQKHLALAQAPETIERARYYYVFADGTLSSPREKLDDFESITCYNIKPIGSVRIVTTVQGNIVTMKGAQV